MRIFGGRILYIRLGFIKVKVIIIGSEKSFRLGGFWGEGGL